MSELRRQGGKKGYIINDLYAAPIDEEALAERIDVVLTHHMPIYAMVTLPSSCCTISVDQRVR